MGKKNSTFKNVMVTLGCGAFAGVVVMGGGYIASSCADGTDLRPAWLDKVEIRVNEQNAASASADGKLHTDTIEKSNSGAEHADVFADGNYAGKGSDIGGDGKPDPDLDNVPQEPRFRDDEDAETETETEIETESVTETKQQTETESESETENTTETEERENDKIDNKDKMTKKTKRTADASRWR